MANQARQTLEFIAAHVVLYSILDAVSVEYPDVAHLEIVDPASTNAGSSSAWPQQRIEHGARVKLSTVHNQGQLNVEPEESTISTNKLSVVEGAICHTQRKML